ncbi:3'-5' exonuclease [Ruegeria lacuscaerulensis]|uniref:3'-5' exonuclease n=1 Tax=Ruegeria lacuscaerulensis TaxID=55218 RepID=UPI00147BA924|nr:3'-5' exonuclease [Ruegeria lacuscaerulensis]
MNFRIADTFSTSLAKLTNQEQSAVKQTAFDLQMNPSNPGHSFHRVDRARDKNFWTVRVNRDIRMVVHKQGANMLLAYVGHHDDAYSWAERRRLEIHPRTGAAQLVEIRERIEDIVVKRFIEETARKPAILSNVDEDTLLSVGVPSDWLEDVKTATEDTILDIAEYLPGEAAEAVLNLAVGIQPTALQVPSLPVEEAYTDLAVAFHHPDAQRRFHLLESHEELASAMDAPWEKWTVFLHPSQRDFVEKTFAGPARVTGSAGTGKTVVALHRAAHLARVSPSSRVLLTTFTEALATALQFKLKRLIGHEPEVLSRISVRHMTGVAEELFAERNENLEIAPEARIAAKLAAAKSDHDAKFSDEFLLDEWTNVVDAWNVTDRQAYLDVPRLGRKTRVGGKQREVLWDVMQATRDALANENITTWSAAFHDLARSGEVKGLYDHIVVDEAQDLSVAELKFLASIAEKDDGLFFAGDIGQRIFRQPFSWNSLGVDIRGRSKVLKVNYRTSHQIRAAADRLLPSKISDVDGNEESRNGVVSVFSGVAPIVREFQSAEDEIEGLSDWLTEVLDDGVEPEEVGLVVRTREQLWRAEAVAKHLALKHQLLTSSSEPAKSHVNICTMHIAKGLEFRAVGVLACDEDVVPLSARLEAAATEAELKEVYETERHLLYVACTRAREAIMVSGVEPYSEFLEDLAET